MDANTESLNSFVTEESKERPFIVVYGKEGLGKTTLVQKVYNKPEIRHKFKGCAWITVTHHLQLKTFCNDILSQIDYRRKDELKADQALVPMLQSALQSNKYLIVLDDGVRTDISTMKALLIEAMPADEMRSKVVITTRNIKETEKIVKERGSFLKMSPLTEAQSWQLICQLHRHPSDFEWKLEEMCRKCEGVPLAVKLVGNLMAWKDRVDLIKWNELQQRIEALCPHVQDLLELSYSLLPEHLKKCLHFLALFPKHADIEAEKLCNLWIAEKMITTSQQAEEYLKELANLCLVQVQEEETLTPTKIKSCSLPHYVRDFCCGKAEEESLFATVDLRQKSSSNQETHRPQVRGLAFYFDKRVGKHDFPFKPKETHEKVRSILFLNTRQQDHHLLLPKSLDLTNCKLLRALDFNWLDFRAMKFPQHINNLAHLDLRYLSFRDCYLEELPPSIGILESLETLDLRVNPNVVCMRISNVLRQLGRLRNLYLPYKFAAIGERKLELDGLSELENLQNFVSTHCMANDLSSLKKLRYLAATFDEDVKDLEVTIKCLEEGTSKSSSIYLKHIDFYSSSRGNSVLRMLFDCGSLNALHVHGKIRKLPWPISDKLTEIFLIGSKLKEDPMPLLGDLRKLQKLGLSNSAFGGDEIICRELGFPQLRYFELSNLPKLRIWTLEERSMRNLSTLTIKDCKSLETLPHGLSTHLQELSIVKMPKTFTEKYESQGGKDFCKIQHVLNIKIIDQ